MDCVEASLVVDPFARYEIEGGLEEMSPHDLRVAAVVNHRLSVDIFLPDPSWTSQNIEETVVLLLDHDRKP